MEDVVFSACAVLPAGGSGERFGTPTPKQFCAVVGRPLVSYTLEAFERVKWIEHIVLVVSPDRRPEVEEILKTYNHTRVSLAEGKSTRHRSIYSGIQAVQKMGLAPDILLIHDAVRPFVGVAILEKVAKAAKQYGAAGAIRPLVSTVIRTSTEGLLEESLDRAKFRASEMPQAFQHDIICKAYQKCTDHDFEFGTECLHLAQKYGGAAVRLVEGGPDLWKVTHKRDIYAAEGMIKEQYNKVIVTEPLFTPEILNALTKAMEAHCLLVRTVASVDQARDPGTQYIACVHALSPPLDPASLDVVVGALTRGSHPSMTSGVILVHFETDPGGNSRTVKLQDSVLRISHGLLPRGMYLNLILVKTGEAPPYLRPFAETVAELAFQRNLTFSGQTFHTRLS